MSAIEIDATTGEVRARPLTAEEIAARDADIAADLAERQAAQTATNTRNAAKALVLPVAQSAVGTRFDLLTASQLRALAAILFWQAGALDSNGIVQPLAGWVR